MIAPLLLALAPLLVPALTSPTPNASPSPSAATNDWLGCWAEEQGEEVFWFEPERCGRVLQGRPTFFRIVYEAEGRASLERWARFTELTGERRDEELVLQIAGKELTLQRVEVPEILQVPAYDFPTDAEVDEDTIAIVTEELRERRKEDQRVRTNPSQQHRMREVDEDNTEFIRSIAYELGWIDAERFGSEAADAAFLIVQHTADLRLMATVLPHIEKDVKAGRLDRQSFALMHDRLQLRLGGKQRYGSQIGVAEGNKQVLMPCEDLERVDELRKEMSMGPLAEYLAYFEQDGQKVLTMTELRNGSGTAREAASDD